MAGLQAPLSTLRLAPHDALRMTRGQSGLLFLSCRRLSLFTLCRSPGALACFKFRFVSSPLLAYQDARTDRTSTAKRARLRLTQSLEGRRAQTGSVKTETPTMPIIPISFRHGDQLLSYFSMVTKVGAPQTVAAQELRIESMFQRTTPRRRSTLGYLRGTNKYLRGQRAMGRTSLAQVISNQSVSNQIQRSVSQLPNPARYRHYIMQPGEFVICVYLRFGLGFLRGPRGV